MPSNRLSQLPPVDDLESQAKISQLAFDTRAHSVGALRTKDLNRNVLLTFAGGKLSGTPPIQDDPALGDRTKDRSAHGELKRIALNGFFHGIRIAE
jgi:hypothetical protein